MASHYSFRLEHPELEKLLNSLRTGERSDYIRQALVFYFSFGSLLEQQTKALQDALAALRNLPAQGGTPVAREAEDDPLADLFDNSLELFK